MMLRLIAGAALAALTWLLPAPLAAQAPAPPRCDADSAMHALDFWVGDWVVRDSAGQHVGDDRVEKILDGCAVTELWRDAQGGEGQSLFYYVPALRRWKQVWVTGQALVVGGLKEKELVARYPDGGTRFQGVLVGTRYTILDRTTLTPLPDGRVHQVIEISRDGGQTWLTTFDAYYARRGAGR